VGRSTDLPWYSINQIAVTLNQAASVLPGDVTVSGIAGGNYGPVTISGSGTTTLLITLAKPITVADRLTLTIGNSQVITYTRRLDVLPGDVNDDGVVNTTDGVLILNTTTPSHAYNPFEDLNGDGAVNTSDFILDRSEIGTTLPGLPTQLAAGGVGPGGVALLTTAEVAPILAEAIDLWAASGISGHDLTLLKKASVQITELPAGYLGETAIGGETIYLSSNADGFGWFTTPTISASAGSVPGKVLADPSSEAADREDLLTVILHELGHTLGLSDLDPTRFATDLMAETLPTGVSRFPSARDVASVSQIAPTRATLVDAVFEDADQSETFLPSVISPESVIGLSRDNPKDQAAVSAETNPGILERQPNELRLTVKYQPDELVGVVRRTSLVTQSTLETEEAL
jgi:hypothetical protein